MSKLFFQRLGWEMLLLHRNNLIVVSVVVTGLYIGLFQLLKMLGSLELFSMLLIINDPAVIGMLFVGITILFEKEQHTLDALHVSPLHPHLYLLGKVSALTLLGTVCGWAMAVSSVGFGINHLHFIATLVLVSALFAHLGIILVAGAKRFIDFALWSSGILVAMALPLFDWFGIFPLPFKEVFPLEHAVRLFAYSMDFRLDSFPWPSYLVLVGFAVLSYFWAFRRFVRSKKQA